MKKITFGQQFLDYKEYFCPEINCANVKNRNTYANGISKFTFVDDSTMNDSENENIN